MKAMQSYNDFSVGGSIAVNVHGQDLSTGQIISTIISLTVLLPTGDIITVNRKKNYDLFQAFVKHFDQHVRNNKDIAFYSA